MQEEWENLENGKSDFWESQQVLKKMEWRWMILDWMNGTSDDCGGRKFPQLRMIPHKDDMRPDTMNEMEQTEKIERDVS